MAKLKRTILKIVLWLFLFFIVAGAGFYFALIGGIIGDVPTKSDLRSIKNHLASEVYSEDGVLLGKYFFENRSNVSFDEIPNVFVDALVATEDARFFEHEGVDRRSLLRVLVKTILLGDKSAGGGSTISQQLIKNLYPRIGDSFINLSISKFREMLAASRLEEIYTKDEILALYLNTVPFGDNTFGIESAADHYFSKSLSELKTEEVAVLVGMLKGTHLYNPYYNPDNAKRRRNVVLRQMEKYGYIEKENADSLVDQPLEIAYKMLSHHSGVAPYFREVVRKKMQKWCEIHTKENGKTYDLYRDGLKIYTTLDADLQIKAEEAVKKHMARLQKDFNHHWRFSKPWTDNTMLLQETIENSPLVKQLKEKKASAESIDSVLHTAVKRNLFSWDGEISKEITPFDSILYNLMMLHTGVLSLEPDSGKVKVWIGGINHKFFQYDHVLARRQVGSTFKPFVFATAIEQGVQPNDFYHNDSIVYTEYENWVPANADNHYGGEYSVLGALVNSVNTVTVQLAMESGIENVIEMAHKLGINATLPDVPSIALGTAEIPLIEMVTAYAPFANGGYKVEPFYISRIEDRNGNVLEQFHPVQPKKVLSKSLALEMTHMLKLVVDSGTGRSLRSIYGLDFDVAGKTGTTQNHADGWFVGFTPELVTGVWTGAENPSVHFRTLTYGQGAYMALPIFAGMARQAVGDPDSRHYFNASFDMMNRRISRQFAVAMYREEPEPLEKIERFIKNLGDLIVGKPEIKQDTVQEKKSFFERIGNLFRKKDKR